MTPQITQIFFDDALQDTYNNRHLLDNFQGEKYISVPTGYVGQPITWENHNPHGELALNVDQLKEMISEGWKIASHGISHKNFKDLKDSQIRVELYMSKEWIKGYLEFEPEYFVSPFDIITPYLEEQASYLYLNIRPYPYEEHQAVFHALTPPEMYRLKNIVQKNSLPIQQIKEKYGKWTAHNIHLGNDTYTIGKKEKDNSG